MWLVFKLTGSYEKSEDSKLPRILSYKALKGPQQKSTGDVFLVKLRSGSAMMS